MAAQDRFGLQSPSTPLTVSLTRLTQRVHVRNNQVLGIWVLVIVVQVWGKYMIFRYLDPQGYKWVIRDGSCYHEPSNPPHNASSSFGQAVHDRIGLSQGKAEVATCDRSRPKTQNPQPILSPRCSTIRKFSDLREPEGF